MYISFSTLVYSIRKQGYVYTYFYMYIHNHIYVYLLVSWVAMVRENDCLFRSVPYVTL